MKIKAKRATLSGKTQVPGSKSHTIRALLLAAIAEGNSEIENPLTGEDCVSCAKAIEKIGAKADFSNPAVWKVVGAGEGAHLPSDVVDVGNSGSVLYFLCPIAATFEGWSIFTGDKSIRTRPVRHLADLLEQAGAKVHISRPGVDSPPILFEGPIKASTIKTDGRLSQYISGMMMAATRLEGKTTILLSDPKETPYLKMTKHWLEGAGVPVTISSDYKHISLSGPHKIKGFNVPVPSDWEAVAFPLIAALISGSSIVIEKVDTSGTQGDDAIIGVLTSVGSDIQLNLDDKTLTVNGGPFSTIQNEEKGWVKGRLAVTSENKTLRVNCSGYPDAVCALAAIACFIEGTIILEDISVCRKKETDRLSVMTSELTKLGADIEEGEDFLIIRGHSPINEDGTRNEAFLLHGGEVESFHDHRVAMSLSCLALGLFEGEELIINDFECYEVSFPGFFNTMNTLGANFIDISKT